MGPIDIIVILAVAVLIGSVVAFIIHQKKRGVVCIGCPDSGSCQKGKCSGCSGNCGSKQN